MISNELMEGVRGVDPSSLFSAQNRRLIKLTTPAINEQELLLESFSGTDALSTLFSFELSLLSQDTRLELKSLIGQPAQLDIELATGEPRYIHGYISRFSLQDSDNGLARYTATLSPWLWMLTRRQDSRVFQEQTVEAIIRSVLAGYGTLPVFEFRLIRPLKSHSYITQYRESDQAFVMRLLEQEGLFFYFVHDKERHTLIVSDHSQSLTPIPQQPQIRYHSASVTELADSITQWSSHRTLQSGRMSLRTFDYKQPRNALSVGIGPKTDSAAPPVFARDAAAQRLAFHYPGHGDNSLRLAGDHAYQIDVGDGSVMQGLTDAAGLTERVEREVMHRAQVAAARKEDKSNE